MQIPSHTYFSDLGSVNKHALLNNVRKYDPEIHKSFVEKKHVQDNHNNVKIHQNYPCFAYCSVIAPLNGYHVQNKHDTVSVFDFGCP